MQPKKAALHKSVLNYKQRAMHFGCVVPFGTTHFLFLGVIIIDYVYWIEKAEKSISDKVKVGQKFELPSLFEKVKWIELTKGERINFGKFFSNAVKEGRFPNVERIQKAENNHAQYVKTKEM